MASEPKINLRLGQRVRVRGTLTRAYVGDRRSWVPDGKRRGREAIIVGHRVLQNGVMESDYDEWRGRSYQYFTPTDTVSAYLVAVGIRKGFCRCLPEQVELLEPAALEQGQEVGDG